MKQTKIYAEHQEQAVAADEFSALRDCLEYQMEQAELYAKLPDVFGEDLPDMVKEWNALERKHRGFVGAISDAIYRINLGVTPGMIESK